MKASRQYHEWAWRTPSVCALSWNRSFKSPTTYSRCSAGIRLVKMKTASRGGVMDLDDRWFIALSRGGSQFLWSYASAADTHLERHGFPPELFRNAFFFFHRAAAS